MVASGARTSTSAPAVIDIPFASTRALLQHHWDRGLRWHEDEDGEVVFTHVSTQQPGQPNRNGDIITPEAYRDAMQRFVDHNNRSPELNSVFVNGQTLADIRAWIPAQGSVVHLHGSDWMITGVDPEAGTINIVEAPADRIRGMSSNSVVIDDEVDIDPEVMAQVIDGFGPPNRARDAFQQAPELFDTSIVRRPTDDNALINEALFEQLAREPSPYEFPPAGIDADRAYRVATTPQVPQHHRMRASFSYWMRHLTHAQTAHSQAWTSRHTVGAINEFTRQRIREDGFYRRILPPLAISNDELDRSVPTDRPVRVVDLEEDARARREDQQNFAAISIPFATLPENLYIRGPRYSPFEEQQRRREGRIVTPRFRREDIGEMEFWDLDTPLEERLLPGYRTRIKIEIVVTQCGWLMRWPGTTQTMHGIGPDPFASRYADDDIDDDDLPEVSLITTPAELEAAVGTPPTAEDSQFVAAVEAALAGRPEEADDRHSFRDRSRDHGDCERGANAAPEREPPDLRGPSERGT